MWNPSPLVLPPRPLTTFIEEKEISRAKAQRRKGRVVSYFEFFSEPRKKELSISSLRLCGFAREILRQDGLFVAAEIPIVLEQPARLAIKVWVF